LGKANSIYPASQVQSLATRKSLYSLASSPLEGFLGSKRWIAAEHGKIGGSVSTTAKAAAARRNGKLGGRPRKVKAPA